MKTLDGVYGNLMAYDTSSLVTEIKTLAKDTSLSDSLVTGWLQATQDRALGRTRFPQLEVVTTPTLAINDLSYSFPANHQTTLSLILIDGTTSSIPEYLPFQEFDECYPDPSSNSAALPSAWTDFAHTLYWSAKLDKAYTLKLRYLRKPVTLTGAVVPDIPEDFKQLLIEGTLAMVEEYRENFDIAAIHQRRAEDLAEDFSLRYGTRQVVRPHKIRNSGTRRVF